jgi:hypothetical protein
MTVSQHNFWTACSIMGSSHRVVLHVIHAITCKARHVRPHNNLLSTWTCCLTLRVICWVCWCCWASRGALLLYGGPWCSANACCGIRGRVAYTGRAGVAVEVFDAA